MVMAAELSALWVIEENEVARVRGLIERAGLPVERPRSPRSG